jgi:putative peptidoglycan lipid II flippase
MTRLTRISILLAVFFGVDKLAAILRQVIIARLFGLSAELDAFNVANNIPDLLFALISGGALAVAFIPVLSEVLSREGRQKAWLLFSRIANLAFILTAVMAVLVAIFAKKLVGWEMGIAPGFDEAQRSLVVELMQYNLIATLIFSLSGLVMAGLQANQHFLFPAMAPLLYNIGQIFGAVFLAPEKGFSLGGFAFPALGLGVHGLVLGVILGAILHLGIQIPGLIHYQFKWKFSINLKDEAVRKVMRLMGPRVLNIFIIQLIFLVRDNLGSRLEEGAVSALAYGWMIQQVPETLIGTAIGTALLPTLAELVSRDEMQVLKDTIERAFRVLLAAIFALGLGPFIQIVFGFDERGTALILWVTRGYLLGLTGHCLLELAARSFYAQQNALIPLFGSILNVLIYILCGMLLYRKFGAAGISLTDSIAFTAQALFLLIMLNRRLIEKISGWKSFRRGVLAALVCGTVTGFAVTLGSHQENLIMLVTTASGVAAGALMAFPFIRSEIRLLLRL